MRKLSRWAPGMAASLVVAVVLLVTGCSSSPSQEELTQLKNLQAEVDALGKEVSSKAAMKADLDRQIADLQAKLKKLTDDAAVVKQRLAK